MFLLDEAHNRTQFIAKEEKMFCSHIDGFIRSYHTARVYPATIEKNVRATFLSLKIGIKSPFTT